MNTPSKESEFSPLGVGVSSSNESDLSQQTTPRTVNTFQDCCADGGITSEESVERLRVSVLYLEGITSSSIPSSRMSVWVGFRSSFPSDSISVTSSNYSSHFLKEGNLLAVESDQVKWTPADDDAADCKSSFSGIAFWDSVATDQTEAPHLEVTMRTQRRGEINHNPDNIELPDILEFHTCMVCERSPLNDIAETNNNKMKRVSSSVSLYHWDNEMEEVHWYNDDDGGQGSDADRSSSVHLSLEQELHHGVAHLKLPRDHDYEQFGSKSKIIHLPVRIKQTREPSNSDEPGQVQQISLSEQNATLTLQVERTHLPIEPTEQIHYAKNTWSNGCECAPPSVKCNNDNSPEPDPKSTSLTKHFRFDTIKDIIRKSAEATHKNQINSNNDLRQEPAEKTQDVIIIEDAVQNSHEDGMNKIQEALESSFKSMNDSKKLAAAMKQQRENEPTLLERDTVATKLTPIDQSKEVALDNCLETSLNDTDDRFVHSKTSTSSTGKVKVQETQQKLKDTSQQQSDQITNQQKNSILSRLLCGADLTEVMLHCDEDHAVMYVDSMSMSSINT